MKIYSINKMASAALALALTACVTMPNEIGDRQASFDGAKEIELEPGHVYTSADFLSSADFRLGARWTSRAKDSVIFVVNAPIIKGIESKAGLQFNIDGKITTLDSDFLTEFESKTVGKSNIPGAYSSGTTYHSSIKPFIAPYAFLNKIMAADSVKVRIVFINNTYADGDFKADKPSAAIRGFKDFVKKVDSVR